MTYRYTHTTNIAVYQRLGGQSTMTYRYTHTTNIAVYQRLGGQSTMTLKVYQNQ